MTRTLEEIEEQVVADACGFDLPRVQPTREEFLTNACNHAESQLKELVVNMVTNRSANYMNEQFPHDYVVSVLKHLDRIRMDLHTREGTPGYGKLR